MRPRELSLDQYIAGLEEGNKVVLGRALTLVESGLAKDKELADQLINQILVKTGNSIRIGVSGVPGVGKSTLIEALGKVVTSAQKKLAVLAVDPSSSKTGGSILGDKTRMEELAKNPLAFIRPTPSGLQLGGVAGKTRESILLCEAAGYEIILVETVGVGQSEIAVRGMVDFFLLLMLAGAGDELQGIKKGIIEMADAIVINKADGDNLQRVQQTRTDLLHALHFMPPSTPGWQVPVLTCSALLRNGVTEIWETVIDFQKKTTATGFFQHNRAQQNKNWMLECFDQLMQHQLLLNPEFKKKKSDLETQVVNQSISAPHAARFLLEEVMNNLRNR